MFLVVSFKDAEGIYEAYTAEHGAEGAEEDEEGARTRIVSESTFG